MGASTMILSRKVVLFIVIKSLFIKLFYNYRTLYGQGLCFCLLSDKQNFKTKLALLFERHSEFFNTNDHLSGFAIGTIMKLEEEGNYDTIDKIKRIYSASLGAIGDNLIFKTIKPIVVLIPLNIALFNGLEVSTLLYLVVALEIAVLIFLNIYIRVYGVISGYNNGIQSIKKFKDGFVVPFTTIANKLIYILIGITSINLISILPVSEFGVSPIISLLIFAPFFGYLFQKRVPYFKIIALILILIIISYSIV